MASYYTATNMRPGHLIEFEGEIYKVMVATHITPGKGNAIMQIKMRGIRSGLQREQRFRSVDTVKTVEIDTVKMEYLYEDGEMAHFMNNESFEQLALPIERVSNELNYLLPNSVVLMQIYEGEVVGIDLPKTVDLKIVECAPYMKGATVTNQSKPAKMETGLEVAVPGFIEQGEVIRIDTATGSYVERAR